MVSYLDILDSSLSEGLTQVSPELLTKHVRYVEEMQLRDGGFPGRRGPSDLYYTDFAVRVLALCAPESPALKRAAQYLSRAPIPSDVIHCFSALNCHRVLQRCGIDSKLCTSTVSEALRSQQLPTGGFAIPGRREISAYITFLGALCYEMTGCSMPIPSTIPLLHCSDGGYSNQVGEEEGSTNPTAAVIGILTVCDGLQLADLRGVAAFLLNMQAEDGGFVPHRLALESDLLSTFTALWTLSDIGGLHSARTADAGRFLKGISKNPSGGFGSTISDHSPDIEYTYYGIGTLSLLSMIV